MHWYYNKSNVQMIGMFMFVQSYVTLRAYSTFIELIALNFQYSDMWFLFKVTKNSNFPCANERRLKYLEASCKRQTFT